MRYLLSLALLLSLASDALAQQAAQIDTLFQARINDAWAQARQLEGDELDQHWHTFAAEAFAYYRLHPDSPTGKRALETAFMMWGNTDAADAVAQALPHIDEASEVWASILIGIGNAYARSDRREDYATLLQELEGRLTHPRARTAVLSTIGRRTLQDGRDAEARPYFEEIIALDADSFFVAQAQGQLYEIDHLGIGMQAPDFTALTLRGDTLRLSDLRGQVVLLDFWATWCGPCLPELPHLAETHDAYSEAGFTLIGVSLDTERAALEAMVEERELSWTHVWQEGKWETDLARLYNVSGSGIPQTYLLDRDGRIVAKNVRGEALREAVAMLVGE